jgi:3-phosphoshikimate 1-carboxyvinyltransferase
VTATRGVDDIGDAFELVPAARLRGDPRLPGDKSISHRALLLALLADGESRIQRAGDGADVRSTATIVRALGAEVARVGDEGGRVDYVVRSGGVAAIRQPVAVLECGNSGTTTRLMLGVLAGAPVSASLDGDGSLRRRPMARVVEPLRAMGARIDGRADATLLPLSITGRRPLTAIRHRTPVPSAQLKSAILLAGLAAEGETSVSEAIPTRDHTERMLRARGVPVVEASIDGRHVAALTGPATVRAVDEQVPADPSGAAFWLVAGAIHPDAELRLEGVSTNVTRRAIIDLLRRMGADIAEYPAPGRDGAGGEEPLADLVVRSSRLRGIEVTTEDVAAAIDEIPVLCLAAAVAEGRTRIVGAGELRHKESDRIAGVAAGLTALGAAVDVEGDDIEIRGGRRLRGAVTEAHDDHRLAMTFAIAGLIAEGRTTVTGSSSVAISDPGFYRELEGVRA